MPIDREEWLPHNATLDAIQFVGSPPSECSCIDFVVSLEFAGGPRDGQTITNTEPVPENIVHYTSKMFATIEYAFNYVAELEHFESSSPLGIRYKSFSLGKHIYVLSDDEGLFRYYKYLGWW